MAGSAICNATALQEPLARRFGIPELDGKRRVYRRLAQDVA